MNILIDRRSRRVPDFLIVGAPRSATSALYGILDSRPGVTMSEEKEPMFFSVWGRPVVWQDSSGRKPAAFAAYHLEDYLRLFEKAAPSDLAGEASTWYLGDHERVITNIRRLYGESARDLRIVMVLREPVGRAWSHYWLKRARGEEDQPFEEAIRPEIVRERLAGNRTCAFDYLGQGRYAEAVAAYRKNFDRVLVLLFDDLKRDSASAGSELAAFLGIPGSPAGVAIPRWNASGVPRNRAAKIAAKWLYRSRFGKSLIRRLLPLGLRRKAKYRIASRLFVQPAMPPDLRSRLIPGFLDDIRRLEVLLGRNLESWRAMSPLEGGRP